MSRPTTALTILLLAGCGRASDDSSRPANVQNETATNRIAPAAVPKPAANTQPPDAKASLPEPRGPIDPKSVEAAGQIVQQYGALIEQKRFSEAAALWTRPGEAAAFERRLNRQVHLEVGDLGDSEGAAGSIYTDVPVVFYGEGYRRPADIVLRRVNDVSGSSEAQRRWHIERIEWKDGA